MRGDTSPPIPAGNGVWPLLFVGALLAVVVVTFAMAWADSRKPRP